MGLFRCGDHGKKQSIFEILRENPVNLTRLAEELRTGAYSPEDMTKAALQYVNDCFDEQVDRDFAEGQKNVFECARSVDPVVETEMRSAALFEVIRLLLAYGLDPNAFADNENILYEIRYIDNEYLAADTLAILFENGGDPNLKMDGMDLFSEIDHQVLFDAANQLDRRKYDALVHCWFVCLGYGAKTKNGAPAVDLLHDFDISKLKNHRDYTFALTCTPNRGEKWTLHIVARSDFWEVARV